MTLNVSQIVQALIVAGLLWVARTMWTVTLELKLLQASAQEHERRLEKLET